MLSFDHHSKPTREGWLLLSFYIRKLSLREVEELTLDHNIQAGLLPGTQKDVQILRTRAEN